MNWKLAARVIAVLAVAVLMVACAIALRPDATEEAPAATVQPQSVEPSSSELLRCREIGAAALDDAEGAVDLGEQAGHRRLAGARVAGEHQMV